MFPKAKESLTESPAVTAKRFYYDELVFDPAAVRFVVNTFGETQILIGTDYPFAIHDKDPHASVDALKLDPALAAAVREEGAARRFLDVA